MDLKSLLKVHQGLLLQDISNYFPKKMKLSTLNNEVDGIRREWKGHQWRRVWIEIIKEVVVGITINIHRTCILPYKGMKYPMLVP